MVAASYKKDKEGPVIKIYNAKSSNVTALSIYSDTTVVTEDPAATGVSVRVSASSPSALNQVTMSESETAGGTLLSIDGGNDDIKINVFVPSQSISSVSYDSSGSLVINPRTLVNSTASSISVSNSGSGDLFVQDVALAVKSVSLQTYGSGKVQWDVPLTYADLSMNVRATGSGGISIFTSTLYANTLSVNTLSSADIFVSTANLTVPFLLRTQLTGSGDINYYTEGTCNSHEITVLGSGDAYTSAIRCSKVKVLDMSSGDVYLAATDSLESTNFGSGSVYIKEPLPRSTSGSFEITSDSPVDKATHKALPGHEKDTPRDQSAEGSTLDGPHVIGIRVDNYVGLIILVLMILCCAKMCTKRRKQKVLKQIILSKNAPPSINTLPANNSQPMYYQAGGGGNSAAAAAYYQRPPQYDSTNYSGTTSYVNTYSAPYPYQGGTTYTTTAPPTQYAQYGYPTSQVQQATPAPSSYSGSSAYNSKAGTYPAPSAPMYPS
ncbi:hypothetical protein AeMF1_018401 [Aphanomyces euteiches]|nr:hypothetical protein AeMF1_018401 [Aphanomyces euteiches]KAH9186974.1 hypothetical protein AeNC1_011045 [Aphanomyces euteiches]